MSLQNALFILLLGVALGCQSNNTNSTLKISEINVEPKILSAYYGLDKLPVGVSLICGPEAVGKDGMPVVFSVQFDNRNVKAEHFIVKKDSGTIVTPLCATLLPANEITERRTVLLLGSFGTPENQPQVVEVVGELKDINKRSLRGLRIDNITSIEEGPKLVMAEVFTGTADGFDRECPEEQTKQIVQLTWEGGVTGAQGKQLGEEQRLGVWVTLENGSVVHPTNIGDDDPDNYIILCLDIDVPVFGIKVDAGLFYDPNNDPNPTTSIEILRR